MFTGLKEKFVVRLYAGGYFNNLRALNQTFVPMSKLHRHNNVYTVSTAFHRVQRLRGEWNKPTHCIVVMMMIAFGVSLSCSTVAGRVYAALSEQGLTPGRVWLLLAVFGCVLPEVLHRSVSADDYKA
jgi:hypothetical protein